MAPVVRGKIRHTFEMRVQIGECNREGSSYHGGVGAGCFGQGCDLLGSPHAERRGQGLDRRSSLRYE